MSNQPFTRRYFATHFMGFERISLHVEQGLSVIVGPHGSGKTAALRIG
jgi:ABC-type Fe3+/spermidine/putrescine transport system ATPase subunit